MKYRIGKIIKPPKLDWLTEERIQEYLKFMGWENLENSVIKGRIWTSYLNANDYRNVYLKDVDNSKEEIIKQILEQLNKK